MKIYSFSLEYLQNSANVLDGILVVISIVQIIVSDTNSLTAFRTIRILKMLRALRMIRFLKSLKFMWLIIDVLFSKFSAFVYLFLMLFLFLIMFTLIGENMYAGKTDYSLGFRENFDTFYDSLLSAFQIFTIVGWTDLQILVMNTEMYRGVSIIYLGSWIVIGNYIFLNLFVGLLIGGFIEQLQFKEDDEADERARYENENPKAIEEMDSDDEEPINHNEDEEGHGLMWRLKRKKPLYYNVQCEESLFLFPKNSLFRQIICRITYSRIFISFIVFVIIFSSLKLALDTYDIFGDNSGAIDWAVNGIFITEAVFKIITYGFILCDGSYMRKGWNILDLFIVVISVIDRSFSYSNYSFFKVFLNFSFDIYSYNFF